jgi:RNA polymerase sigma factor (TIGR02999 family)
VLTRSDVTRLLGEWGQGDPDALDQLMPAVFDEVRGLARRALAREAPGHTLQPTALVHEVYLRLSGRRSVQWKNRDQFFGFLADLMRRILVDHARRRHATKRGSGVPDLPLDDFLPLTRVRDPDLVALDDALGRLARTDPRKCRIVELHFFVGLSQDEIADVLGVSRNTIVREMRKAKIWLRRHLDGEEADG